MMQFTIDKAVYKGLRGFGLLLALTFVALPIIWLALTAFKLPRDAYTTKIIFTPTFENFQAIFTGDNSFLPLVANSAIIAILTVAIAIPIATMAAYAFSRYAFKGKHVLLVWVLSSQFIPSVVVVLPFFTLFRKLGLIDSHVGLVILNLSFVLPFSIWMIKGFIDGLNFQMEEAAFVDGCTRLQTIWHVTLPLIMPGVITSAVFAFIQSWNEFLFALILTKKEAVTLTIGIMSLNAERGIIWEQMAAAGFVIMVPIFLLSLTIRKYFTEGLTMGAVK